MPYYRDVLLSAYPSHMEFEVGAPPAKIDPTILSSLTRTEFGAHATNPRKTRRNQIEETRRLDKPRVAIGAPKFLSEQAKDGSSDVDGGRRMSDVLEALGATNLDGSIKIEVPVIYRNVEIKYSKFGVDDFDFECVPHTACFARTDIHHTDSITRQSTLDSRLTLPTPMLIHYFN